MRYIVYKSTDLLDSILLHPEAPCRYVRLTDAHLRSPLFNRLLSLARSRQLFLPWLLSRLPAFRQLRRVRENDVVVLFDIPDLTFIGYLRRCIPSSCSLHAFYWNPMDRTFPHPASAVGQLKAMGFQVSTFDRDDANAYQLSYRDQFIRCYPQPDDIAPRYDYYFLGASKGREQQLAAITNQLSAIGRQGLCIIPKSKADAITYRQNIGNVLRSRCLIEVVQQGQAGVTLRALEALVYRKKLITTCRHITQCDFYDARNILVWDRPDAGKLAAFLSSPFVPVSPEVVRRHDLLTWISSFQ